MEEAAIQRRLECDGASINTQIYLIDRSPRNFAFSLLLCQLRHGGSMCHEESSQLMMKIFLAIEDSPDQQMRYCIKNLHGDRKKQVTSLTVVAEALTLLFSQSEYFTASPQTGNLVAIELVKRKYPKSILYVDSNCFTPLHGACGAKNIDILKYFIEWHLEEHPFGRGGLYTMNDCGMTPMDTLIDTSKDIVQILHWLQNRKLLNGTDVDKKLLIHRAAFSSSTSTLEFFLKLFPQGALLKNDSGRLPIQLHLSLRCKRDNSFSEEDFDILKLLIRYGIINGGIFCIGGIFHPYPNDETSCSLSALRSIAGESNADRIWETIDSCLNEIGCYENAPIVHSAIRNKSCVSKELFLEVLKRYGATMRDEHSDLPLHFAIRRGINWDDGLSDIWKINRGAIYESDGFGVDLLSLAASNRNISLATLYELALLRQGQY